MHLAFVTSLVLDGKPTTGFEVANEAIVAGLRAIGCKITIIGFRQTRQGNNPDQDTVVLQTLDVENASASNAQKFRWLAGALASGLPIGGSKLRVIKWLKLREVLNSLGDLDGLVINSVQMPTAFPELLDFAPYIYIAHNVEHQSSRQNAISDKSAFSRYLYQRDARLLEPIERNLIDKSRFVFCLSDEDRSYFALDDERAATLQLVFPQNTRSTADKPVAHDVGLIGTWSWQPNFVGLQWFVEEVVPLLDPDMKISIAGSLPHEIETRHPGLKFVGRVPNAEGFVTQSRVLALVSRSGTGVQLKTIEAFQMGMPCCATPSSVRGIANIPGNCEVFDEAVAYAKALNNMVSDVRSGKIARLDGQGFANSQRKILHKVLRTGTAKIGK